MSGTIAWQQGLWSQHLVTHQGLPAE